MSHLLVGALDPSLRVIDGCIAHEFAGCFAVEIGRARDERGFLFAETHCEDLAAGVPGGGSAGSGAHGHEATVSHDTDLTQYTESTSRIAQTELVRYDKSMTTTREPVAIDDDHPDFDHLTPKPLDQDSAYAILLAHMLTGNELAVASIEIAR